jgi:hypothetical protein
MGFEWEDSSTEPPNHPTDPKTKKHKGTGQAEQQDNRNNWNRATRRLTEIRHSSRLDRKRNAH